MKVYVNARFLTHEITGVERFAIEISKELKKKIPNIVFVSPQNIVQTELAKTFEVIKVGESHGHYWEQITLPNYLNKVGKPLLLNLTNTAPISYKNKITTFCDISPLLYPKWYSFSFSLWYKFLLPRLVNTSHFILTISNFCKDEIISFFNIKPYHVKVIPCALPSTFDIESFTESKGNYFLCVSSINPRKNFERVVNAFNGLNNENYKLFIVGANRNNFSKTKIYDVIDHNNNIVLMGRVSDLELKKLYKRATGFIYASLYEGFGIPPLEAQALGCPVLASNIEIHKEVLRDSVVYCDAFDESSIIKGMLTLINSKNDNFIISGYENVKRYSWEKSAEILLDAIKSIV